MREKEGKATGNQSFEKYFFPAQTLIFFSSPSKWKFVARKKRVDETIFFYSTASCINMCLFSFQFPLVAS